MHIEVRFHTRSGNTKIVAEAIADVAAVTASDCSVPVLQPTDLLFLGGSVYGGSLDKTLQEFISSLDPAIVKCVAVFGTSALKKTPEDAVEGAVRRHGIPVLEEGFHCRGSFAVMHRGHPDENDLKSAKTFAENAMKKV